MCGCVWLTVAYSGEERRGIARGNVGIKRDEIKRKIEEEIYRGRESDCKDFKK
jgi:hypothetical protein